MSKGILLGFTPTNQNSIYYNMSTKEKKSTRHCVIDEAHYSSKTDRLPFANDMLNTCKSKSPSPNKELLPPRTKVINSFSEIMPHQLYLTNQPNAPSFIIKIPVKGSHPTLGFETSLSDANRLIIDSTETHAPGNRTPKRRKNGMVKLSYLWMTFHWKLLITLQLSSTNTVI